MLRWTDSHCHLDAPEFDADRDEVVARARAGGVWRQLLPAIDVASCRAIAALAAADETLLPAYGLHPMYLDRHDDAALDWLESWIGAHRPVAIGECGLDFFVTDLDPDRQRLVFERQVRLAVASRLPLVLHARRAVDDVIAVLRRFRPCGGVVHSFSGSRQQAEQLFALGFALGIGGPVTYERAQRLRGIVADMPIEFLLLETDAPDQPSAGRRGCRHEPGHLDAVIDVVCSLRSMAPETLSQATEANVNRIFALSGSPQAARAPHAVVG